MEHLNTVVKFISKSPGIYQFFDENGKIIYIGKAKNLKSRVSSYFNKKNFGNKKTKVLVSRIKEIKTIKVESEMDALLLENILIKKHQPKFNVQMKDDKTYPWICIKKEPFPRLSYTRKLIKDGSIYFGPYHSVKMVKNIINFLIENFKLRNCSHKLTYETIDKPQFKTAVEYYIGNCNGCCQGEVTTDEYKNRIHSVKQILNGNIKGVIRELKSEMNSCSAIYKYEDAQELKIRIQELENYQARSAVVSSTINNVDVFTIEEDNDHAYINYIKVFNGAICQSRMIEVKKKLDEDKTGLLELAITDVLQYTSKESIELVVPFELKAPFIQKITIPLRGERKKLLDISSKNAFFYMKEKHKKEAVKNPEKNTLRIMETIQKELRMKELPLHMECFDNSNFQGNEPVSACVVFKSVKPQKKEYRHYNIKSVSGPDDYASMEEVVYRRYNRILNEGKPLPQLIILDGGKGQLSSAMKSIERLGIKGGVAVIAIAKKLEEIYYPGDQLPLYINKKSETLRIIQYMRNEAHRFSIQHHRSRRIKGTLKSQLTLIKGIGLKTTTLLFKEFKTIKKLKTLSLKELEKSIGKVKAKSVYDYFHGLKK